MGKKTWTQRKRARSTRRWQSDSLYLTEGEVRKLRNKLKLPTFKEAYKVEDIKVTTIPRLENRMKKAEREGREPEDLVVESNLIVLKDETFEDVKVVYKQNVLNAEKARELGKAANFLYDKALFVPRSHGKQVGTGSV